MSEHVDPVRALHKAADTLALAASDLRSSGREWRGGLALERATEARRAAVFGFIHQRVRQRQERDCGVAALAILTGQPYDRVYEAACFALQRRDIRHREMHRGLHPAELRAIAVQIGVRLELDRRRSVAALPTDEACIANVRWLAGSTAASAGHTGHWVVARGDLIWNPARNAPAVEEVASFLARNHGRIASTLRIAEVLP
jgi:hypothetical protein